MRLLPVLLAAMLLVLPGPAAAYGVLGHETIAAIALRNTDPRTAAQVRALLARAPLLETPTCAAATPAAASVWPDCIRNLAGRFSYTNPWHYQNVDICRPFDLKSACRDGNCVSAQIDRQVKLLQDRTVPRREKVAALAFLIHFVGDLHMPLHAGDRGDRGGNDVKAAYGIYAPEWLNLHAIWDTPLADRAVTTPPALTRAYSPAERTAFAAGTTEDWSREAWTVSRDTAYRLALGDPCGPKPTTRVRLDEASIQAAIEPQRLQVTRAGLRLARLLDEAFDPARAFTPEPRRR
ncbi:S1/P1 nuclease [uncultured Sphingomonas sp.]|uniref:S1/P1 nuclease n=1 Tax=uncultured Sphingomonas sp. TaxID=158754 RepID=UPI0035CA1ED1